MSFATKDLLLIGAIVGGGYLVLKTTKLGESLGSVGEGVGEAVGGVGAGLGTAGKGVGEAIYDISGHLTKVTGDVAELTSFVGEFGNWTAQQFEEMQAKSAREASQSTTIDWSAFKQSKEDLAIIQAQKEIKAAEEKAERDRLIQEEKTQYVEFATTIPEKLSAMAGAVGGGLLSAWKYTPTGLLTSWITSQSSVEENVAIQQSAPSTTSTSGVLSSPTTSSLRTPSNSTSTSTSTSGGVRTYSTSQEAAAASESGEGFAKVESGGYVPLPTIKLTPEPEKSTLRKIGGWLVRRMMFF